MFGFSIPLDLPAPTLSEFGIYYIVFGIFVILGFVMLGMILVAEPSPQYDIDSLEDMAEPEVPPEHA